MKNRLLLSFISFVFITIIACGCSDDKPSKSKTGPMPPVITGIVADATDSIVIEGANVILYNANTNEPVTRAFTDSEGLFFFTLENEGNYFIKIEAQNYFQIPPKGGLPIPFEAPVDDTTRQNIYLNPNPEAGSLGGFGGYIKSNTNQPISGALVIASSIDGSYSGTSGPDGYYVFFNIPPSTYEIECHISGYMQSSIEVIADVNAGVFTVDEVDVSMTPGTFGTVRGHVSFVAIQNPKFGIDITLIHPDVQEAIPGLSTYIDSSSGNYTISAVPYDTYIVWATYQNDGYVMDPDAIHKFDLPVVSLSQSNPDTTIDFKVTGAIELVSPTNIPDSVYPVEVFTIAPEFTWIKKSSYASIKEYIIEVFNDKGESIWGGFDNTGVIRHPKIPPAETLSVVYNFDSSASEPLNTGEIYRWKVYADNNSDPNVQTLLSSSEYLMGLFKVTIDTSGSQ